MAGSSIEWTDVVWNPVSGCTRVSAGCDHCYAVTQTHIRGHNPMPLMQRKYAGLTVLNGKGDRHFNGQVRTHDEALSLPLGWKKPRRVFVNSMSDLFHRDVPFNFIDRVFAVMALTRHITYQILTKRPERMVEYLANRQGGPLCNVAAQSRVAREAETMARARGEDTSSPYWDLFLEEWPLPNVWLGTSIEDQATADARIPHLLKCPAAVRFLSCEPLLGPVDISAFLENDVTFAIEGRAGGIPDRSEYVVRPPRGRWVIVGGESGSGARPMHPDWARSIRDQCQAAGVPFFFKQWGEWLPRPLINCCGHDYFKFDNHTFAIRVGKKAAGRLLDGREWNEFPNFTWQPAIGSPGAEAGQ